MQYNTMYSTMQIPYNVPYSLLPPSRPATAADKCGFHIKYITATVHHTPMMLPLTPLRNPTAFQALSPFSPVCPPRFAYCSHCLCPYLSRDLLSPLSLSLSLSLYIAYLYLLPHTASSSRILTTLPLYYAWRYDSVCVGLAINHHRHSMRPPGVYSSSSIPHTTYNTM